ncbi:hypothetical protein THAOC_37215, partial [Thalassiosira oceanica]
MSRRTERRGVGEEPLGTDGSGRSNWAPRPPPPAVRANEASNERSKQRSEIEEETGTFNDERNSKSTSATRDSNEKVRGQGHAPTTEQRQPDADGGQSSQGAGISPDVAAAAISTAVSLLIRACHFFRPRAEFFLGLLLEMQGKESVDWQRIDPPERDDVEARLPGQSDPL